MTDEARQLTELIEHHYDTGTVTLQLVHLFENAGRGIYRVEQAGGPPWLLRAQRSETPEKTAGWFARSAATLLFLAEQAYPAPHVIRTRSGGLTGVYHGWAALMLTFVEGSPIAYTPDHLHALGAVLGRLHALDANAAPAASPPVPDSRFQPGSPITKVLVERQALAEWAPSDRWDLYSGIVDIFRQVDTWRHLPQTIVHCDCWPTNAIRTGDGQIVLVDWDNAGLGVALLDLGYLLAACQLEIGAPTQQPRPERVRAVVEGYCRQRTLSAEELALLPIAVRFGGVYPAARSLCQVRQDDQVRRAQAFAKLASRSALAEATAAIAYQRFREILAIKIDAGDSAAQFSEPIG